MREHGGMTPQAPSSAGARRRRRGGPADLVRSLVVVLAVVAVIIMVSPSPTGDALRVADFEAAAQTARLSATYGIVLPGPLPTGWHVVTARTERDGATVVWRVGLRGPDGAFITIEQSTDGQGPLARGVADDRRAADVVIDGASWRRFTDGASTALVRTLPDSQVLVSGEVPSGTLALVAGGLHQS